MKRRYTGTVLVGLGLDNVTRYKQRIFHFVKSMYVLCLRVFEKNLTHNIISRIGLHPTWTSVLGSISSVTCAREKHKNGKNVIHERNKEKMYANFANTSLCHSLISKYY